jgi:DNA-binding MarR family transcriptional regulator
VHFTDAVITVAMMFADAPDTEHWANEIARATNRNSGHVADILHGMEDAGWLTSRTARTTSEEGSGHGVGQTRRLYQLAPAGRKALEVLRPEALKPASIGGGRRGPRPHARHIEHYAFGTCSHCLTRQKVRKDGLIAGHGPNSRRYGPRCEGSLEEPLDAYTTTRAASASENGTGTSTTSTSLTCSTIYPGNR